jgi:hypothetical protein
MTNEFLNEYVEFVEFDWGIITIYSCPKSCEGEDFVEEVVKI